jgi:hypothetical protein
MVDTLMIYPLRKGAGTFEKVFGSLRRKKGPTRKDEHSRTDQEDMEDENAQERKKYLEVSGLAAIQAKEKQAAEAPVPDKESMAAEVKQRLATLPKASGSA